MIKFSAIIPAAGSGKRSGQSKPKQWLDLGGEPMVVRALRIFEGIPGLQKVAIALNPDELDEAREKIKSYNLNLDLIFCAGGKERQNSVAKALDALNVNDDEIVVIHDAARPFASKALVSAVVQKAFDAQAAIAAVEVTDTIKEVDRLGYVKNTPRRGFLRSAQTPQAVRAGVLSRGLALADQRDIELTDDAIAAELIGFRVAVVMGEEANVKITSARDVELARLQIEKGEIVF